MDGFEPFVIAARDILSFSSATNENVWFRLENNPTTRARLCVRFFFRLSRSSRGDGHGGTFLGSVYLRSAPSSSEYISASNTLMNPGQCTP